MPKANKIISITTIKLMMPRTVYRTSDTYWAVLSKSRSQKNIWNQRKRPANAPITRMVLIEMISDSTKKRKSTTVMFRPYDRMSTMFWVCLIWTMKPELTIYLTSMKIK